MAFSCERSAMISGGLPKTMASAFGVHEGSASLRCSSKSGWKWLEEGAQVQILSKEEVANRFFYGDVATMEALKEGYQLS